MKKHALILFTLAALCGTAPVLSAQDTLTVVNPSKVQVITATGSQQVEIFGSEQNPDYYFSSSIETSSSAVVSTRERLSQRLDFSVPIFGDDKPVPGSRKPYGSVDLAISPGFGVSFPGSIEDDAYSPMRQAWGLDFTLGIINADFHPWGGKSNLYLNFGLEDKSFKIRGDQRYVKGDDGVLGFAPYDGTPKWSALRIFSWNLSAGYYQHIWKDFGLFVEPVLNFNTGSRIKTKWYDANDRKVKEKAKFGKQKLVTYELMGGIKIGSVKAYVKYNPGNLLEKGFGPDFATWSVGIIL